MGKPSRDVINGTVPISALLTTRGAAIERCNVCGEPSERLGAWRECDDRDRPTKKIVFIGKDDAHARCCTAMEKHPRLYKEETGMPGYFPLLCGPCVHRERSRCTHPRLKANGGEGLPVTLSGIANVVVCIRPASAMPVRQATKCEGRKLAAAAEG